MLSLKTLAAAAALALGSVAASAVPVTETGSHIKVTYDSALVGLFGAPTLVGDVLSWFPSGSPGFTAQTGGGIVVTNSTFAVKIEALPGWTLTSFSLTEGGDYFYFGPGADVSVSGQLRVTPLVPASPTISQSITQSAAFISNPVPPPLEPAIVTHDWTATAGAPLIVPGGVTQANASIQNILGALANPNQWPSYAFIEKKNVALAVSVTPVPEPETYAMMLAGLGAVLFLARRRQVS